MQAILQLTGENSKLQKTIFASIATESVDWNEVLQQVNNAFDQELLATRSTKIAELKARSTEMETQIESWNSAIHVKDGIRDLSKDSKETRSAYSQHVGHAILSVVFSNDNKAEELRRRGQMETEEVKAVLAAAIAKARTGKWPARLEETVPKDLKAVPKDMYSKDRASPVKYLVKENGIVVYSVGENGKDDGGVNDRDKGMDDLAIGVK